jgi:hypothetical protein
VSCHRLEDEGMLVELGEAMDAHVEQCEDCQANLRAYQQVAGLIAAGVTAHRAPPDWKQRTLARVRAVPRTQRRRVIAPWLLAAAAAIAGIMLFLFFDHRTAVEQPSTPELAMQIVDNGGWRGEAHPGEELRARALRASMPHFEIRVYRGARDLLVRCPDAGPPVCLEPDRSLLVWKLPSVGTYQVLLLVSQQPIAAPRGSLNDDVAAATAAGARALDVETLNVR